MRLRILVLAMACALPVLPEEKIDWEMNARIRQEGMKNSQVLRSLHFLADVYGPRLTGSPNLKAAQDWALSQMKEWGLENGHLEPWDFGHAGWLNDRFAMHIVSPVKDSLVGEVLAWTPGTNGPVTAEVIILILPDRPMQEKLTAFFEGNKDKVRGKIVLAGKPQVVPVDFAPAPKRLDDAVAQARFNPSGPNPQGPPQFRQPPPLPPGVLASAQVTEQLDRFLVENGAVARVNDAGMAHGMVRAFNNRTFDLAKAVPTVVLRNEDYGRIARLLADNRKVEIELEIANHTYEDGKTAYNAIAELPGSDKRDEVIILGAHIDSWHSATGATDNAIGSAIMMEAARILKAAGAKPRRTIRVGLWSGEEQGLLGSQAYVKEHYGTFENPKPEYAKFAGNFNIDSGTGRARGLGVFGPDGSAAILREAVEPFADLGVAGVTASKSRRLGGTDSTSFNQAGLPGIGVWQDPIEYFGTTWHTNLDTYERIVEDDVKKAAVVIAGAAYHLAMRDEMLPRFPAADMPLPPSNTLAILHKGGSSLGLYSMQGELRTAVPVGPHPHEMVVSKDGRFLYTTDNGTMKIEQAGRGGNTVSIVDLQARKKVGEINLGEFRRPHGIALDPATGRLAVSTELPDRLLIIDPAARKVIRTYETKGKTSHMVTFGPGAKYAYVSNSNSANVSAINLETGEVKLIPAAARPEGSVLSPDGKFLYVCNREGQSITIIDTSKNEAAGRIETGKGPVRAGITPDGKTLIYAAMHDKTMEFADIATRKVTGSVPLSGTPVSLRITPDGTLAFASGEEQDTTFVVSIAERKVTREIRTAKGLAPDAVIALP